MTGANKEKSAMTPLGIIALFLSVSETVAGITTALTEGALQIAFGTFAITFPLIIAASFFVLLWKKNHVLYPPSEFGNDTTVGEFVDAMHRSQLSRGANL